MRECSDAGAARRLLRLTPCWRHGGDVSACRRLDGGCIGAARSTCAAALVCALQLNGADGDVQVQEQLEQRALLARATATGRAVDSQCECRVCK